MQRHGGVAAQGHGIGSKENFNAAVLQKRQKGGVVRRAAAGNTYLAPGAGKGGGVGGGGNAVGHGGVGGAVQHLCPLYDQCGGSCALYLRPAL